MTNFVWTVINLDQTVSNDTIQSWISFAGVPSCFRFVFQSPFANAWTLDTSYSGSVPMPMVPWTIIVSSATDPRFNWTVMGMAIPPLQQATIGHWTGEPQDELGARMWHEILHCYDLPADNMQSSERAGFTEYLRSTGSVHYTGFSADPVGYEKSANHTRLLIEFYTYLTHKYMGCECFSEGCVQQPVQQPGVLPEDVSTPSETSGETSDREEMMKKLIYMGGIAALVLLIL